MIFMKKRVFIRGEFIGERVTVLDRRQQAVAEGTVTWETKNMLHVGTPEKRFSKQAHNFVFHTDQGEMKIEGKAIMYRPEDRIKRCR